ncbi:putative endonuclease [Streptococcus rupicaprae]|uniref:Endonuclease n=1 Tax=Streptococcus rupicaprae TaxID=759619 RepID=A0ABV2FL07_9STRE
MENKPAYFYVLRCSDDSLYTGYTTDLDKRLKTHNAGKGAKYTRARLPVSLLYSERFDSKQAAMSAESRFKRKKRSEKLAYIAEHSNKTEPGKYSDRLGEA